MTNKGAWWKRYTHDHHVDAHPLSPYRSARHSPDTDTAAVADQLAAPAAFALAHFPCRDLLAARLVKVDDPAPLGVNGGAQGRVIYTPKDRKCGHLIP